MPQYLDPTGRSTYGIAICARCGQKFCLDELMPDPNSPGLMVCVNDRDDFDPYRLPARPTENISLPFTRPDTPLTFDSTAPATILLTGRLEGSLITLSMTATQGDNPVTEFRLYRSVDGAGFVLLATVPVSMILGHSYSAQYPQDVLGVVPSDFTTVQYYVVARDDLGQSSSNSNIVDFTIDGPEVPDLDGDQDEELITLDMEADRGTLPIVSFLVYRSIDGAAYVLLDTVAAEYFDGVTFFATVEDEPVFAATVDYYVVAVDGGARESDDSNIVDFEPVASGVIYVVGSTGLANWQISEDGVVWTPIASPGIGQTQRILWLPSHQRWVAMGTTQVATAGVDAAVWTLHTPGGFGVAASGDMAYDPVGDVLVIVSDVGASWYSTDGGITWTLNSLSDTFSAVAWDPVLSLFVVPHESTGSSRPTYKSPDGVNWTANALVNSMGCNSAASNGAGEVLAVGPNSGIAVAGAGAWYTNDGTNWTNRGLTPNLAANRSLDSNGVNWAFFGQLGGQNVFTRSTTGNTGTWTNVNIISSGTGGTTMQIVADKNRNRWWTVARNRVHFSTDALGTAWTVALTGAGNLNAIGVKP